MRSLSRAPLLLLSLVACARGAAVNPRPGATSSDITAADLQLRLFAIAHDSMRGRDPGDVGNYKTTDYVAREFQRLRPQPAGDNGTYFQTVPFMRASPGSDARLEAGGAALVVGRDFVPVMPSAAAQPINGASTIYAGSIGDTTGWPSREA